MEKIYGRTKTIQEDKVSGFCPGCMHSTVIKLIGEVLEEMELVDRAACVLGIGCCGLHMDYIAYDNTTAPHGRACAVATGMKRSNPDSLVFTYQGDGDFASIGLAESISAANVNKTKQAIHKAFQNQLDGKGFSMVEIVTSCPTNWGLDPMKSLEYIEEKMLPEFPLGVVRDR